MGRGRVGPGRAEHRAHAAVFQHGFNLRPRSNCSLCVAYRESPLRWLSQQEAEMLSPLLQLLN